MKPAGLESVSVRDLLVLAGRRMHAAGVRPARPEGEFLMAHVLGWDRARLVAFGGTIVPAATAARFSALVDGRCRRVPAAYLAGEREFMGLAITVTPAVLIPRPETEILVETVLRDRTRPFRLLDIGTGSGCITTALLKTPGGAAQAVALDISPAALAVARGNAERHGVAGRVEFRASDLCAALDPAERFDVITANLPYVTTGEWAGLDPEVRDHEPRAALDGGADGLDLIRRCVTAAGRFLAPGGALYLEVGHTQAAAVAGLIRAAGNYGPVRVVRDYSGIDRVVCAGRAGSALGSEEISDG
ncbi:MAG: peptide chain release factor N(5)-glutamine methyltransferase [Planctomycetota bacterium]